MRIKKKNLLLMITSVCFFQCSPTLNYMGNNFAPTTKVSIFFDSKDIQQKYAVMGLLTFNLDAVFYTDKKEITNLMINKAKEVGADAVLVTKFSSDIHQEISEKIISKKMISKDTERLFVEAKFLKFEK